MQLCLLWVKKRHKLLRLLTAKSATERMGKIVPKPDPCSLVHRLFMLAAAPFTVDTSGYVIIPSPKVFSRCIFATGITVVLLADGDR